MAVHYEDVEDEPSVSKVVGELLDEAGYEHVSIADHTQIAEAIRCAA